MPKRNGSGRRVRNSRGSCFDGQLEKCSSASTTLSSWTRRTTTARSPKRSFLGPAERKHRRAGSSEQQILLLARGEAGASTRDRDAIGSRFEQKAARTRSRLRLLPVVAHARDRALADRASVSALIDRCCFHRRSGVVDPAALARIAARAGSDSRLQPVKHEPHGSGATLSLAFRTSSRGRSYEVRRDCWVAPTPVISAAPSTLLLLCLLA